MTTAPATRAPETAAPKPGAPARSRPARVALLGCGTVGSEVARRLVERADPLGVSLVRVLVRDTRRARGVAPALLTDSFDDVLASRPDLIVEAIGGVDPAAGFVEAALSRGIDVVSANKTLLAHRGPALERAARRAGTRLAFEASVCAAVPLLAALRHLRADHVRALRGIINGSCNFILGRLAAGEPFDAALARARALGLVEPDPAADISGRDSAEKLCVLAWACGLGAFTPDRVETTGIDALAPDDFAAARQSGHVIKLLADLDATGPAPALRVGPAWVPRAHPLAQVAGADNAVIVSAELAGDLLFRGAGAGPRPTASAILGDVSRLLGHRRHGDPAFEPPTVPRDAPAADARALHADAPAPHRGRHLLRVRLGPAGPRAASLFDALRADGLSPGESFLTRASAHVLLEDACPRRAALVARRWRDPERDGVLVMPVLG